MLSARAGAVLGVLVILVAILAIPSKEWISQRARIAELADQLAARNATVSELETRMRQWNDPAYIETQARERLHFVMPGEVGYVVIPDSAQTPQQAAQDQRTLEDAPSGVAWWAAMWSTVKQVSDPKANGIEESAPAPATPAPRYDR